ncbi:hypothetical protein HK405_002956 [Cladochytrium tenue]|nr:hypothetical protein HK405_002956 [Cladochytrium tenue]
MFSRATAVPGAVAETTDLPLQPEFHYSRLMTRYPNLTTAQLINANNYNIEDVISGMIDPQATPSIPADADVVVAGAGMASLIYAIELKRSKPEASIVVLEKSTAPIYKIGESTLSPFSRFCQSNILPVAYMLRLFSLKEGLDFALVDRKGGEVYYQDIGGLDYSFQLERKISELLFTMKAQQLGIKVFYGVSVVPDKSDISSSPSSKTVGYSIASSLINGPGTWSTVHASVDAVAPKIMRSPARTNALARWWQNVTSFGNSLPKSPSKSKFEKRSMSSLGHQSMATRSPPPAARSSPAPVALGEIHAKIVGDGTGLVRALVSKESKSNSFGGMNFNSYWAYFEEDMHKPEDSVRDWLYPATNHLCFNEGWSWWM